MATAGHVDHGKSALVRALTGTDPDRLPEEKARGITIDLGFAHLSLPAKGNHGCPIELGIVDVPGHEDFVKNMVAGAGSVHLALLVVAADDGWMPQTEEHLQILTYLGIRRAVIALTKTDLVSDERPAIQAIRERVRDTPFSNAPVVPTSIVNGRGMHELKLQLRSVAEGAPACPDLGKPRLFVDRSFTLPGVGTIVTGSLTGGSLARGQTVAVQPRGTMVRIRGIQNHNREVAAAWPGMRTALCLADIAVEDLHRGDVITLANFGKATCVMGAVLEITERASVAIKDGARVRLHYGSGSADASINLVGQKLLSPGQKALAHLKLGSPCYLFAGDRFVIRDSQARTTLAGGAVLDPHPPPQYRRSLEQAELLRLRAAAPEDPAVFVKSQVLRDRVAPLSDLLAMSRFAQGEISDSVKRLAAAGELALSGASALDPDCWRHLRERAMEAIDAHHRAHPQEPGLPLPHLQAVLGRHARLADVFALLISDLCKQQFTRSGSTIRRATHQQALPAELEAAAAALRARLAAKSFDPPSRKQLASDPASQQALRFLIQNGEAVEISSDIVMDAKSWQRMISLIRRYIGGKGSATIGELRQALLCSRRVLVPCLERMDREGITLRNGDFRILRIK